MVVYDNFEKKMTDWANPDSLITPNFCVREALLLPSWGILHTPSEEERDNIVNLAETMEKIRAYLVNTHILVHCWIRPTNVNCPGSRYHGQNYNAYVKGAGHSQHIYGKAVDWSCETPCDRVREDLVSLLVPFNIRMEKLPMGSPWIHIDTGEPVSGNRYFLP